MDSILTTIKKMVGIDKEDEEFDLEIITHINSVFMDLNQIGVGPSEGFYIEDDSAIWDDFIAERGTLEAVRSYIYLRVKLLFDSNTLSSSVIESMNRQIDKLEWRLKEAAELLKN